MTRFYLGIDIGGTKIKAAVFRGLNRQKPWLTVVDTPGSREKFLKDLDLLVKKIAGGRKIEGIGVGVAGIVDRERGVVIKAARLPFLNGVRVKEFFGRLGIPVRVDNDVRCFLRAEAAWGAAKGYKNVVGLAIGTGIGGGIMIDEKIYYGSTGAAGEFGHTVLQVRNKNKIKTYEFEVLVGRAAVLYGNRSPIIGIRVANLINAFDPDLVILGGGGISDGWVKTGIVRRVARNYIISPLAQKTPIVNGKLGYAAGAIGAALLFSRQT